MRSTPWILAAALVAFIGSTADGQPCTGCGAVSTGHGGRWSLGCDACCAPPGYCLAPGCCEYQRHCCDNAWAGYCEHRSRVQAFWSRVGVPKNRCEPTGGPAAAAAVPCPEGFSRPIASPHAEPRPVKSAPTLAPNSTPLPTVQAEPSPAIKPLPPVSPEPEVPPPPEPGNVPRR
ncbi:MAG: hypothetical protein ABFC96_18195 [Thermoguttaceae bacterium]